MTITVEGDVPAAIIDNREALEKRSPLPTLLHPLEGRVTAVKPRTVEEQRAEIAQLFTDLDSTTIGGRITICVLCYGDFYSMHHRCLTSLLSTVPKDKIDLRVGCVQLGDQSRAFITQLIEAKSISKAYWREDNPGKYKVMRQMFYDDAHPITTSWLIWVDDDTMFDVNHEWLTILAQKINATVGSNIAQIGPLQRFRLYPNQIPVMKAAKDLHITVDGQEHHLTWYKERWLVDGTGRVSPNGVHAPFATGSFWAARVDAIRTCQVPDPRLVHNGGDYWIGLQFHQGGYAIERFSDTKKLVNWSSVPRRGMGQELATHVGDIKVPHRRR